MSSRVKWLKILALFICPILFFGAAAHAETVLSRSVYKGSISGWKVEMERTLKHTSDDRYELRSEAKNLFASIREVSEFEVKGDQIRPLSYLYERKIFGRTTTEAISFDWPNSTAHYTRSDRPQNNTSHQIEPGILDPALYQVAMQADLTNGVEELSYRFVKRKRIDTYTFLKQSDDELKIGKQAFAAEVVSRKDNDKDKATTIWVIPSLHYQVGQIQHTDDGDTYQIRLAEYRGDTAKLQQLYQQLRRHSTATAPRDNAAAKD